MSQNQPINLQAIASPEAQALASQIRVIESEVTRYFDGAAEVFKIRTDLETRIQAANNDLRDRPSAEKARELIRLVCESQAYDAARIRLYTPEEFTAQVLPRRFPNMRELARDLCQACVNILHPLRIESEAIDAKAAADLGMEKVVSSRTNSIAWLIDEVAIKGTWQAAAHLAGVILDTHAEPGTVPLVIN